MHHSFQDVDLSSLLDLFSRSSFFMVDVTIKDNASLISLSVRPSVVHKILLILYFVTLFNSAIRLRSFYREYIHTYVLLYGIYL